MNSLFSSLFGPAAVVQIHLDATAGRSTKRVTYEGGGFEELFIYRGAEGVQGEITISPRSKIVDHAGIKVELVGQIEMYVHPILIWILLSRLT